MKRLLCVAVLVACGSGSQDAPDAPGAGPSRGMWRLDVSGSASAISIDEVAYVDVPVDQDPMPALGAQYMALAWAGTDLRAAVPVAFSAQAIAESADPTGTAASPTAVALPDAVATVFIAADAAIDHVDLVDPSGTVRATTTSLPRGRARIVSTYLHGHVRVLGAGELSRLPSALRSGVLSSSNTTADAVDDATPDMLAALDTDLGLLAPNALDAVQTVAVVKLHNGGDDPTNHTTILGVAWGSAFIVNERFFTEQWSAEELKTVLVHEAAHSYQFLLDYADSYAQFWSDWPADIREHALVLRDKYRLGIGLVGLFQRLQASGVSAGISGDYTGPAWTTTPDAAAVAAGFATGYGSTNAQEDIAEVVASIQYPAGMDRNRAFCPTLHGYGPQLVDKDAMPYVKAKLLAALGFIDGARLDACLAGIAVSPGPGMHLGVSNSGDELALASGSVAMTNDNGPHLVVTATGAGGYIATLQFRSDVANGIGLHRLDASNMMPNPDGDKLVINGPISGDHRTSGSGLLIVTAADPASAEGLLFFVEEDNDYWFPTDVFAFSTFHVP